MILTKESQKSVWGSKGSSKQTLDLPATGQQVSIDAISTLEHTLLPQFSPAISETGRRRCQPSLRSSLNTL